MSSTWTTTALAPTRLLYIWLLDRFCGKNRSLAALVTVGMRRACAGLKHHPARQSNALLLEGFAWPSAQPEALS